MSCGIIVAIYNDCCVVGLWRFVLSAKSRKPLVSIVTPVHNGAAFVAETVRTVCEQTYSNWEWLIVDDKSDDDTLEVIRKVRADLKQKGLVSGDIRIIRLEKQSGAAKARNAGIKAAHGRFLAFLDADDLWERKKLATQVDFMLKKDCAFSFTGYEFADATGKPNGKVVRVPSEISYRQALRNTTIWTSTVMLDLDKLTIDDVLMPVIASEDTATWWNILKKVECAHGLDEVLSYYRRSGETLSSNKLVAISRIWNLYRKYEKLGLIQSSANFVGYAFNAVRRRV